VSTLQPNVHYNPASHGSEAPKTISNATAPAIMHDTAKPGRSLSGAAEAVPAVLAAAAVGDGVASPSELDALPRRVLSKAHSWRMLFTREGKLGVSRTAVWLVLSKQSAHCGKTDWNVSVQAHLITLMNAPGLKITKEKLASTGAAAAQELIRG